MKQKKLLALLFGHLLLLGWSLRNEVSGDASAARNGYMLYVFDLRSHVTDKRGDTLPVKGVDGL